MTTVTLVCGQSVRRVDLRGVSCCDADDELVGDDFDTAVSSTEGRTATRKRKTLWASSS